MCPSTGVGLVLLVCLSVLFQRGACFFAPHPSLQRHVSVGRGRRAAEVSNSLPLLSRDPGYSVLFSTEVDETEKKEGVTVTELGGETKPPAKEKDEEEEEEEDEKPQYSMTPLQRIQAETLDIDPTDPKWEGLTTEQIRIILEKEKEKFYQRDTGEYECGSCGYTYREKTGDGRRVPPGTLFKQLPEDWRCPQCRGSKTGFQPITEEVAGYYENKDYGIGFNTWTANQKSLLIYGGLAFGFTLFMAGYLLQ